MKTIYYTLFVIFGAGGFGLGLNYIKRNKSYANLGAVLTVIGVAVSLYLPVFSPKRGLILALAFGIYGFAAILFTINNIKPAEALRKAAKSAGAAAFVVLTLHIVWSWKELGRAPFQSLGETMIILAWCITVVYFIFEYIEKIDFTGLFSMVCALLTIGFDYVFTDYSTKNLPPALQSAWFVPHVLVYFLAYATLTLAVLAALGHIVAAMRDSDLAKPFDKITYKLVRVGFPFLTVGLIFGSFWGQSAWGDYWGWDPKENWSAVTWLIYLMYLHLRFVKGWNKTRANYFIVLGGLAVFVTYLAVSYLPSAQSSVHVYQ